MADPDRLDRIAIRDCWHSQPGDPGESKLLSCAGSRISEEQRRQVFLLSLSGTARKDRLEARARMFFYGGEDPATGSAAGCAASWMVQHGIANSDEQVLIRQGVEIRRPSEMYVRATRDGQRVTNVRVGGYAVEVLRGTVNL